MTTQTFGSRRGVIIRRLKKHIFDGDMRGENLVELIQLHNEHKETTVSFDFSQQDPEAFFRDVYNRIDDIVLQLHHKGFRIQISYPNEVLSTRHSYINGLIYQFMVADCKEGFSKIAAYFIVKRPPTIDILHSRCNDLSSKLRKNRFRILRGYLRYYLENISQINLVNDAPKS